MAFPTVQASASTARSSANPLVASLPAGITALDYLFLIYGSDNNIPSSAPSGWTELYNAGTGASGLAIYYRIADGSEGSTVSIPRSSTSNCDAVSFRVSGCFGTPEVASPATGSSANPDSSNLAPSWGVQDTLWFSCYAMNGGATRTVSSYPSGFTGGTAGGGGQCGCAYLQSRVANVDPAAYTISASNSWVAQTFAVQGIPLRFIDKRWTGMDFTRKQVMY